ncbi:MAG: NnrU family protein [Beijerinckiaceae bacterium]
MSILILGLVVFFAVHTLTTLRARRAGLIDRLGETGYKAGYSIASAIGLALIVYGFGAYRAAGYIPVWEPPTGMRHAASLLMWPAFVALAAAYSPAGLIKGKLKHPMLVGVKAWALAHLLANGDLGSMILFGSFLGWAVYDRIAVKRRGDLGAPPAPFGKGDVIALAVGTVAFLAMLKLHGWLIGVSIFG